MNKQRIPDILSSIQMSPRDKKDLIKELKSNNVHCIEIFDTDTLEFRSPEDVYKEYENNKDKFIIGSCDGIIGTLYPWHNDYSFCFIEPYYGELYIYNAYYNIYNGLEIYEENVAIGTIFIDANEDTLIDYTFDDLISDRIKLIKYNNLVYTPIASILYGDYVSFLLFDDGGFHQVDVYLDNHIRCTDHDFDFGNSGTGSLKIDVNATIEGLSGKITDAIHNGTPIFIGAYNQYEQVLHATCYSFDYGTVYLYTKTSEYKCVSDTLIPLGDWEHEKVIRLSNIGNVSYDDLLKRISNGLTILLGEARLHIVKHNNDSIECYGLNYEDRGGPFIGYYKITKDSKGKCICNVYYKTKELIKNIVYINNTTVIYSNDYNIIIPTKDISIKLNKGYNLQYAWGVFGDELAPKYVGEIEFSDTVYNITFTDIIWSTDSVLDFKPNHLYRFEIQEGLGIMKEFVLPTE